MAPCLICGKQTIPNEGRKFPDLGSPRRQMYCAALGVPLFTFDNIKTRRLICLSHFDEDQFHMGRHILTRYALPRRLTEREKFILYNSGFNKSRFRKPPKKAAKPWSPSPLFPAPVVVDAPLVSSTTSEVKDLTTSSGVKNPTASSKVKDGVAAAIAEEKVKTINDVGKVVAIRASKIQKPPAFVRKMFQAPVSLVSLPFPSTIEDEKLEKALSKRKSRIPVQITPRAPEALPRRRFKLIRMPPSAIHNLNDYALPMPATKAPVIVDALAAPVVDGGPSRMLPKRNRNVQTISVSSAFSEQKIIKKEEPDSDIEVLPPPPVKDVPSTSKANNNSEVVNTAQEAELCSNTNLILARCLQYTESLPNVQPKNDVKVKSEIMSNANESVSQNVQRGYKRRQRI